MADIGIISLVDSSNPSRSVLLNLGMNLKFALSALRFGVSFPVAQLRWRR
jgi:hypothetical protein